MPAFNWNVLPEHAAPDDVWVIVGNTESGPAFSVTVLVEEHKPLVAVTVYVMVD